MANPLVKKLENAGCLTDQDRATLERACGRTRHLAANHDIIGQGGPTADVHLVLEGIAIRYKLTPDGKRQIVAVLLPGDFCDLNVAILRHMDHAIATSTACTIANIPAETINNLTHNHPRIARALWWATLVDEATLRQWLTNLGQRDAIGRLSHFFCELLARLQSVGLAADNSYDMPLRQTDLADLFGISTVHVNRILQEMRGQGLVSLKARRVTIPDVDRLEALCGFDPSYLHLTSRESVGAI